MFRFTGLVLAQKVLSLSRQFPVCMFAVYTCVCYIGQPELSIEDIADNIHTRDLSLLLARDKFYNLGFVIVYSNLYLILLYPW